ncbi:MAG: hypothetical protein NZ551_07810 [Microscillaceae bacterium]|nr:hypothetical protein [Microscillaceae bacterium]MDW8461101.1 hypothetical protein [Cytophagales bacterium]
MLNTAKIDIYKAIAELAYAIAKVDSYVSEEEKKAFFESIERELERNENIFAEQRFKILDNLIQKDVNTAYNHALFLIRQSKQELTEEMLEKITKIAQKVAESEGILPEEKQLLDSFKQEVISIYFQK